jgi:hypothetical protein
VVGVVFILHVIVMEESPAGILLGGKVAPEVMLARVGDDLGCLHRLREKGCCWIFSDKITETIDFFSLFSLDSMIHIYNTSPLEI